MVDTDKTLTAAFAAKAENYRDGQTIFLIDGSGSMPMAYGGEANPVVTAVGYAAEVKQKINPAAEAFFFSMDRPDARPIPLDDTENALRYFPGGPGFLLPMLKAVLAACENGSGSGRLHLVIVSDGEISDIDKRDEVRDTLLALINRAPGAMVDIIMPGRETRTVFNDILGETMSKAPVDALTLSRAPSAEELPVCMAKVLNTRSGAQAVLDLAKHEAVNGLVERTTVRSPLKFRKNNAE
jgi:hypothetical protein